MSEEQWERKLVDIYTLLLGTAERGRIRLEAEIDQAEKRLADLRHDRELIIALESRIKSDIADVVKEQ